MALNNLGDLYGTQRDYARAEDLLRRSLALGEKLQGPDSYFITNPLTNLGIITRARRDNATAEAYYRRALSIRSRPRMAASKVARETPRCWASGQSVCTKF
jgi:Tfp pilus assembly protein PilF